MRDLSLETLNNELKKNNISVPFIISPLSKLKIEIPTQSESTQPKTEVETTLTQPVVENFTSVISLV
jgi:hypothetical protein